MSQRWVFATLHSIELSTARTTREVVELRVDGNRIGQLTPAMSAHVLPAMSFLATRGLATAARVLLMGNRTAATAKLHCTRSHDLDDAWFAEIDRLQVSHDMTTH